MKKIAIALLAVLFMGLVMSSCRSKNFFSPYGEEISKYQFETRY